MNTSNPQPAPRLELKAPHHLEDVPGVLREIIAAWQTFQHELESEVEKLNGPLAAVSAAAIGGTIGAFRMIVNPTIEGLAAAIETNLAKTVADEFAASLDLDPPGAPADDLDLIERELELERAYAQRADIAAAAHEARLMGMDAGDIAGQVQ